jgi:hypothetical protein
VATTGRAGAAESPILQLIEFRSILGGATLQRCGGHLFFNPASVDKHSVKQTAVRTKKAASKKLTAES